MRERHSQQGSLQVCQRFRGLPEVCAGWVLGVASRLTLWFFFCVTTDRAKALAKMNPVCELLSVEESVFIALRSRTSASQNGGSAAPKLV
jgi:hypothetical protein